MQVISVRRQCVKRSIVSEDMQEEKKTAKETRSRPQNATTKTKKNHQTECPETEGAMRQCKQSYRRVVHLPLLHFYLFLLGVYVLLKFIAPLFLVHTEEAHPRHVRPRRLHPRMGRVT